MSEKQERVSSSGEIFDANGKSIGMSGTSGPIGHPGAVGPPGGGPPYVGQFRWCTRCKHSYFVPIEDEKRYDKNDSLMNCPVCVGLAVHITDAWCPEGAILIWEEEVGE
jgi:hypothetical protein